MDDSDYDESSRYLCNRAGAAMMHWFLQLDGTHIQFDSWLNTVLTWPNMKERVCDAVACMTDLDHGGLPFAAIVEFQTVPDPKMFGRMLVAGGLCWLTVKPADLPGNRFELCAVVVNLTGQGDCARHMTVGTTEWKLTPRELNLSTLDAAVMLEQVAAGQAPREVLAWISLMKKGGEDGTIKRWLEIVTADLDEERRGDYALVRVFAGAVGRQDVWIKALEGLKMNESPVAKAWRAEAERTGLRKGKVEGKAELLVGVLQRRLAPVPEDLVARIRASTDRDPFDSWLDSAYTAKTIEEFRQATGL